MEKHSLHTHLQRDEFFTDLYLKLFPKVAKYIAGKGGSLNDARDVFQDSVIIYYEKIVAAGSGIRNEQAYIMGIAKHLWFKKFSADTRLSFNELPQADIPVTEDEQLLGDKLLAYLENAGQKCMELLKAFYYDGLKVQQVAELFGYSGVRSATVQKYKCLEKVRDTVKQKALYYEDFIA